MNHIQLYFLKAYIDLYALQDKDIFDVIKECSHYLHNKETMEEFNKCYNHIIFRGTINEVKEYISKGHTFFDAYEKYKLIAK